MVDISRKRKLYIARPSLNFRTSWSGGAARYPAFLARIHYFREFSSKVRDRDPGEATELHGSVDATVKGRQPTAPRCPARGTIQPLAGPPGRSP
jgi:hypothetical protein